jgi:hypothetical protein
VPASTEPEIHRAKSFFFIAPLWTLDCREETQQPDACCVTLRTFTANGKGGLPVFLTVGRQGWIAPSIQFVQFVAITGA